MANKINPKISRPNPRTIKMIVLASVGMPAPSWANNNVMTRSGRKAASKGIGSNNSAPDCRCPPGRVKEGKLGQRFAEGIGRNGVDGPCQVAFGPRHCRFRLDRADDRPMSADLDHSDQLARVN